MSKSYNRNPIRLLIFVLSDRFSTDTLSKYVQKNTYHAIYLLPMLIDIGNSKAKQNKVCK